MSQDRRPYCPRCVNRIDRMQHSFGLYAVYPCGHWLPPAEAERVRDRQHATHGSA